ncbi:TetR family transcriptional regulator [Cellulomonas sp. APG4]|uniref:TetR family transcriptional regulator n=1 Tax=Cellulomonas sp. APG4 TaxID=1538656 RepID=UPI001ED8CEB0|nr:TetR family transcriptional regulator [Cellulomonas sp. APG4]
MHGRLAARKREVVRDELAEAALHLLAARGYEAVTVDEIATAAGVSRRTFFRYFASKEDVVVEFLRDLGLEVAGEIEARPAGEASRAALEESCAVVVSRAAEEHPVKSRRLAALVLGTPDLRARYLARQDEWREAWGRALATRGSAEDAARVASVAGVAAFDLALRRWAAADGASQPRDEIARAFADLSHPWGRSSSR